jgi:O-glycosyl hydrolase
MNKTYTFIFISASLFLFSSVKAQKAVENYVIDISDKQQIIENIGTSACWFSEPVGKYFPAETKELFARLLFSKDTFPDGSPCGIGVSSFRFNIGAGSSEPDSLGGIANPWHRVECFADSNGNYNWDKQIGYQWFLQKAKDYKVENLIAFVNSPPVFMTKNTYSFKTEDDKRSNLKQEAYTAYANFLSKVMIHFDSIGLHFNYISPINEPQWDWLGVPGKAKQEGTPWSNEEIANVTREIDKIFTINNINSKIIIPEAAMLNFLSGDKGHAANQAYAFLNPESSNYVANLVHLAPCMLGHSYFTDNGDKQIISVRRAVDSTMRCYKGFSYWQSEYSMLGNGYKEEKTTTISEFEGALFLSKIIHSDLVYGNATAWQFWNTFEPYAKENECARYYLIGLKPNSNWTDAEYRVTKNLYILGHYSRFIRPGMQRINIKADKKIDNNTMPELMISAYVNNFTGTITIVAINYTNNAKKINFSIKGRKNKLIKLRPYITTSDLNTNLKALPVVSREFVIPERSIVTLVELSE